MNRSEINFLKQNRYHLFPKTLQIEITRRCPFNCSQCYKTKLENTDMDFDYALGLMDTIEQKGVSLFVLNGGEPLLYPKIVPLLQRINKMETAVNIFSSGYGLTKEIVDLVKTSKNIYFYISLNGSSKEINGLSRQGYETAMKAVALLKAENAPFGINWVARHDNATDFVNMVSLCRNSHAVYLSVIGNKLTGRNEMESPLIKSDLERIAAVINNNKDANKESEPKLLIESCFSMLSTYINAPKSGYGAHCNAGISNCNINCDLSFQPCTHLKVVEQFASIMDYWHSSSVLKTLRDNPANNLEPCRQCRHRGICSLCRAVSIETCVDFAAGARVCINFWGK
ncbi:MAG: radical SAM protein [Treponema sp.]|jgi:pyrroloquinoline quinone biosynthesis protein E|nr:radical SAM protein [Treponema sp.]